MKFSRLSKAAKARAIEWWIECEQQDWDATDNYEDMVTGLKYLGITVDQSHPARSAHLHYEFEWSGFYSQGDGLVFKGEWEAEDMDLGGLVHDRGKDSPFMPIGARLMALMLKHPQASASIRTRHYGGGSSSMYLEDSATGPYVGDFENELCLFDDDEETLLDAMKAAARVCYEQLRDDYEDCTSEESAVDAIEANGYEFDKEGEVIVRYAHKRSVPVHALP